MPDPSPRPDPFEHYAADELWTDEHTSKQMLACHLDPTLDLSSRNHAFIDRSVAWVAREFDVGEGTRIVDFGCGPGLYTTRFSRLGAEVTGIDFSTRSIEYARASAAADGLSIRHIEADYLDVKLEGDFDLITMIMCDFCALGPAQRATMLRKSHGLLAPGGAALLDVVSLAAFEARREQSVREPNLMGGFWSAGAYEGLHETFKYDVERVVLDRYTIVEEARTRTIHNWLQHFSPESLERELNACGLVIDSLLADVAGSAFDPDGHEFAVVARRAS